MSLYRELRERRVFQFTSAYIVGGFGLIQFLEFLEGRMALSPNLVNLVGLAGLLLLPSAVMLAWAQGRPGRDALGRTEKVAVPVNCLAAAALLFVLFNGKELGAVTRTVEVQDEHGAVTEREVPKREFRRRLVIFYPDVSGADAGDVDGETAAVLLAADVGQDIFLDVALPLDMISTLRDAGHPDGRDLPRPLMRKIAGDAHYDHFVTGSVRHDGAGWSLVFELTDSETGREVSARDYAGEDLFALIDAASYRLREDLGLPDQHLEESRDLPVTEITSPDLDAVRAHVAGMLSVIHRNDWAGAIAPLEDAVARDPGYALAQFMLFGVYQTVGRTEDSERAVAAAMDNLYRVTERTQFLIKSQYYFNIEQDMDKALAVMVMWTRIYPTDVDAYAQLALYQYIRQDLVGAVASYEAILNIDPTQYRYLEDIANLYRQLGETDRAEATLQRYVDQFPGRADGYRDLADFYERTGRLDKARESYEQADLLEPGDQSLVLRLIDLDIKQGRFADSEAALDDHLERADKPRDRARIYAQYVDLALVTGRPSRLSVALDSFYVNMARIRNPLQLDIIYSLMLPSLSVAGRPEETIERLDAAAAHITAPFDSLTGLGRAWALSDLGRDDEARTELDRATRIVDTYQFETFRPSLALVEGMLAEHGGDEAAAVEHYRRAVSQAILDDPLFNVYLANAQRRIGDDKGARETLEQALTLYPAYPAAHLAMARLEFDRGRSERAREHLEAARAAWAEAEPEFGPARIAADLAARLETTP